MLEAIRQKKENLFYTLILVAIIGVMIFVYGAGKMSKTSSEGAVVAWVNGEAISQRDFQQILQYRLIQYQQMLGSQFDERLISAFKIPESTLEDLIRYRLLSQQALKRGFYISDEELASKIRSLPYYQKDGQFDSEQYLKLPNRGLEEMRMRRDMETGRWQTYLLDRIRLTPDQIKRDLASSQAKIELAYAKVNFNSLAPNQEPSASEVEGFLKKSPPEIKNFYESHIKDYTEPAAVELRKIRVGIPFQASDTVKAEAKKKAQEIEKDLNTGNFESVAKNKSDDENAKKGGLAGWINRGTLEKPLEEAIDKLKVGEVSPLVETPFGYFFLKLENKRDSKIKPLDSVNSEIARKLIKEQKQNLWANETRKSLEQMLSEGKSVDKELKKWKVELKKTGTFNLADGNIPGIGQVESILDGVSELTKAQPQSKKLFYYQDNFYLIRLVSFEIPKASDLEKNQEVVEKKLISSMQKALMDSWQNNLLKSASVENELSSKKNSSQVIPEDAES